MLRCKFTYPHKVRLRDISYLLNMFLIFSLLIDPTNVLFGIKNAVFVLFLVVSIMYANFKHILIVLTFIMIYFVSLTFGILTHNEFDFLIARGYLKAFLFFSYLFWTTDSYLQIFRFFYLFSILVALAEIVVYVLLLLFPFLEPVLREILFALSADVVSTFDISHRVFLGVKVISVYFRTSPICIISLSISLFLLFKKKSLKFLLFSIILFMGLIFSGTRANMLAAFIMVAASCMFYSLYEKKNKFLFVFLFVVIAFSSIFVILMLLQDSSEVSLTVKSGHFHSLMSLFAEHPMRFFFIGTGPASYFYSVGSYKMEAVVELTYLELIRYYGFIFTLVILSCVLLPIYYIVVNKNYDKFLKISLIVGYFLYLMIAGTNPLLVSSTGFIVVCTMFYLGHNNILLKIG